MAISQFLYPLICLWLFPPLVTVNSAAMNIHIQEFVFKFSQKTIFTALLGIYLGVKLLSHMVTLCLLLLGNAKLSSIAGPFYIPTGDIQEF